MWSGEKPEGDWWRGQREAEEALLLDQSKRTPFRRGGGDRGGGAFADCTLGFMRICADAPEFEFGVELKPAGRDETDGVRLDS